MPADFRSKGDEREAAEVEAGVPIRTNGSAAQKDGPVKKRGPGKKIPLDKNLSVRNGVYRVCFTQDGKRVDKSTGIKVTIPNALKLAMTIRDKMLAQEAEFVATGKRPHEDVTLDQALAWYYRDITSKHAPKTKYDRELIHRRLKDRFGETTLTHRITNKAVLDFVADRTKEGAGPHTINTDIGELHRVCQRAHEKYDAHPVSFKIERLAAEDTDKVALTLPQALALVGDITIDPLFSIVKFALFTGIRMTNIMTLKWEQIEGSLVSLRVKHRNKRDGRPVKLRLNRFAMDLLHRLPGSNQREGYVFARSNGTRPKNVAAGLKGAAIRVGLSNITFHNLRHTFATWHGLAGTDSWTLKAMMTHSNLAMTEHYTHVAPDKEEELFDLDAAFQAVLDLTPRKRPGNNPEGYSGNLVPGAANLKKRGGKPS